MGICNMIMWPEVFVTGIINYPTPLTEEVKKLILSDLYIAMGNIHLGCTIDNMLETIAKINTFLAENGIH